MCPDNRFRIVSAVIQNRLQGFEHILITDNLGRNDLIIIDRQVTETALKGKRIDLLALKQVQDEL